jgi:hypothetical protein
VTVAPATTAPFGSVTRPFISDVETPAWANADAEIAAITINRQNILVIPRTSRMKFDLTENPVAPTQLLSVLPGRRFRNTSQAKMNTGQFGR